MIIAARRGGGNAGRVGRQTSRLLLGVTVFASLATWSGLAQNSHVALAGIQRPSLTLLSQSSTVSGAEGSFFLMSLRVSHVLLDAIGADTRLVLTSHRPVTSRADVRAAVDGDLPQIIDAVSYPLAPLVADASAIDPGRIDLTVRTEIAVRSDDALQMSATGVYPLTIDVMKSDERLIRLVTFVERLEPNTFSPPPTTPMDLALVGRFSPAVSTDTDTEISSSSRRLLADWASLLERRPGLAASIAVQPEFLDSIGRSAPEDRELLIRLQRAATFDVMSSTYVSMDPSDADRHGLGGIFTRQLRLGESVLASLFPARDTTRRTWLVSSPLSSGGARFLADLGFRTVVVPASASDIDARNLDATRLVDFSYSDDGSMTGAIADPNLSEALERGSFRPAGGEQLVAHQILADLKALRTELSNSGVDPGGSALVMSTTAGDMPSPAMTDAVFDVISRDPRFSLSNLDDTLMKMLRAQSPERVELRNPIDQPSPFPASATLSATVQSLESTVDAFASALPRGDDRVREWRRILDVLPDNRLGTAERQQMGESIRSGVDDVASLVVPPASTTFTLGGRNSPIRFSIRNDGSTDLDILVRLRSSKLRLPEGDKVVTLPAGSSTAVEFAVSARSNGRFPVALQLLTPSGEVLLGPPATLTARVNAIAGLGQLVTGIALLFLLSWWANHFRRQYRLRQSESGLSSRRHPAQRHSGDDGPA